MLLLILLISILMLFVPLITERIIESELVMETFTIPASIPWDLQKNGGVSRAPGFLQKFFGFYKQEHGTKFNTTQFVKQFGTIELLGATGCSDPVTSLFPLITSSLECYSGNEPQAIITSECTYEKRAYPSASSNFGVKSLSKFTLKVNPGYEEIVIPSDQRIYCELSFEDRYTKILPS
mmetsp:Transcript_5086/g.8669  ORF Transcript_5086/g.8669 Transcript_5086/m.8669 type:complete len:179 (+) Transcript_5086:619-1155(+)